MPETVTVTDQDGESRLDRWFRRHYPALGHGGLEKLLRTGQVRVDGRRAKSGDRVSPGMAIRVPPLGTPSAETSSAAPPRARPQDEALLRDLVIHRDEHAIVLNKPAGLAVQGGSNTTRHVDGMLDGLRFDNEERPRLVHRLDKDTSGVLLIARTAAAAAFFTRAFRDKTTRKTYWAIVAGLPKLRQGKIDLSLTKGALKGRERVQADEDGKDAVTYYTVIDSAGDRASWLALLPLTGRTHQLRAHCAAIGAPILGDGKYGGAAAHALGGAAAHRLHLHARSLEIPHPAGFTLKVTAPLPPHMKRMWEFLGFAGDAPDPFRDLHLAS
ncbi:MAG: RluA family pseudouridine synthase [Stellaceae bacterium]